MSDAFRQSTTDKASSALKPDSQKSTLEQAGDSLKSTSDNVAGSLQPSSEKSTTQRASDNLSGANQKTSNESGSYMKSAQDTVSSGLESAGNALGMNQNKK